MTPAPPETVVVDASAVVEALLGTAVGIKVRDQMRGHELHAPAHLDAEVLSALGRLHRAQKLKEASVTAALRELRMAPIRRHALAELISGAWERRNRYRLVDGLYVELTEALGSVGFLTTDAALARSFDRANLVADGG